MGSQTLAKQGNCSHTECFDTTSHALEARCRHSLLLHLALLLPVACHHPPLLLMEPYKVLQASVVKSSQLAADHQALKPLASPRSALRLSADHAPVRQLGILLLFLQAGVRLSIAKTWL